MKFHTIRLLPGRDLRQEIDKFIKREEIKAGFIATCVGGLRKATLRMAGAEPNKQDVRQYEGKYEIVALSGTVSRNGSHLHIALSDKEGHVIGGHLTDGSTVTLTAEVVIGEIEDQVFRRLPDKQTGFDELTIEDKK